MIAPRNNFNTAIHFSGWDGDLPTLAVHLEAGADVDQRDFMGRTSLMGACKHGHTALVAFLVANGASCTTTSRAGRTPLDFALTMWHTDVALFLVFASGAKPDHSVLDGVQFNPNRELQDLLHLMRLAVRHSTRLQRLRDHTATFALSPGLHALAFGSEHTDEATAARRAALERLAVEDRIGTLGAVVLNTRRAAEETGGAGTHHLRLPDVRPHLPVEASMDDRAAALAAVFRCRTMGAVRGGTHEAVAQNFVAVVRFI